jgi:hypothetical protein
MHRTRARLAVLLTMSVLALVIGAGATAAGQAPPGLAASGGAQTAPIGASQQPPPPLTPAETQKLFDGYVLVQARVALGLTDAQFPEFVTKLMALQDARSRHQQERRKIVAELARLTGPRATGAPDEAKIREQMKALADLDVRATEAVRRAQDGLDQVLDLRQQARFRVFEDQVERKRLDLLLNARRTAAAQAAKRKSDK